MPQNLEIITRIGGPELFSPPSSGQFRVLSTHPFATIIPNMGEAPNRRVSAPSILGFVRIGGRLCVNSP